MIELDLFDFELAVEIGHAASPDTERIIAHCVHLKPTADGFEASATDSYILAVRSFHIGIDGQLERELLLSSSALFEAMNAIKRMVKIERGKYDPSGWRVHIDVEDDALVTAINPFKETRGSVSVNLVDGEFPNVAKLADTPALAVTQVGFNPALAIRLAKSTGDPKSILAWRFTGERSVVHVRKSDDSGKWWGIIQPPAFDRDLWEVA